MTARADDVRLLARTAISFVAADGNAGHAPLVTGRIGDVEMRFVLDTGSEVHLLTKELVDTLGLPVEPGEDGVDHSGATMPSWSVEDVTLSLGGAPLQLRGVVAIPAPAPFPGKGIGGILSPQHLHPAAIVVIDLVDDELVLVEAMDDALVDWLRERGPSLTTLRLERDAAFTTPVVDAAIRPYASIPTLLNTGGRGTEFSSEVVPRLGDGAAQRLGGGVSGADVVGSHAGAQVLVVAGHDVPVARLAVRNAMHDPQGMVGMDVLRGSVLACAADPHRPVVWQVPSGD